MEVPIKDGVQETIFILEVNTIDIRKLKYLVVQDGVLNCTIIDKDEKSTLTFSYNVTSTMVGLA